MERRSGEDRRKRPRRAMDVNKVARLQKLIEANSALATVESVQELLPSLLKMAQEVTYSTASSIMFYESDRNVLRFALALNETKDGILETLRQNIELNVGEGIAGWVAEHRQPVCIDDAANDPRFFRRADRTTGFTTRAVLCAPILHGEELLGVVQCLNPKDRDHFNDEDLELLGSFADLASVALVRGRLMESRIKEERFEAQLEAASDIQENIRPRENVDEKTFAISGGSESAIYVGGDMYDFFRLEDGTWITALIDVSGKGLPAALIMTALWSRMRSICETTRTPGALMAALNRDLIGVMQGSMFATAIIARYFPERGAARTSLAGHLPPLLFGPEGVEEIGDIRGLPLGVDEESVYEESEIVIPAGGSLLFISDGVTEARDREGEFFEMRGVEEFADNRSRGPWGEALIEAVNAWRKGAEANDDTTYLEIMKK